MLILFAIAGVVVASDLTGFANITATGTIEGATLTEGGDAVYSSGETPGGELGGTWASPTIDNDALDDQYYDSESDLTTLLDNNYMAAATDDWVDESGDTMTGDLTMGTNDIFTVQSLQFTNTETTTHATTDGTLMWDNSDGLLYYEDAAWHTVMTDYSTNMDEHTFAVGTITEGGNAVYNSAETPGGELGGTWASPTVDSGIHDDEYIELGDSFAGDVSGTYSATVVADDSHNHIYSNIDSTTSANWATRISDETGTGNIVFSTSPTLVTPTLGAASATRLTTTAGDVVIKDVAPEVTWIETDQANDEWRMIMTATNMYLEPETTDNSLFIRNQANANVLQINTGTKAATFSGAITTSTDLTVTDDLFVNDFARTDALRVGTTSTDPGDGNLYVEGDLTVSGTANVGQWTYVETITPSASSYITVDNIDSSWKQVKVVLVDIKSTADGQHMYTQMSTTNGASWITSADYAYAFSNVNQEGSSVGEASANSQTGARMTPVGVGSASAESLNGEVIVWNPGSATTNCQATYYFTILGFTGDIHYASGVVGLEDDVVSDVDAVRLYFGGGNTVASGTVHVYRSTHN